MANRALLQIFFIIQKFAHLMTVSQWVCSQVMCRKLGTQVQPDNITVVSLPFSGTALTAGATVLAVLRLLIHWPQKQVLDQALKWPCIQNR